MAPNDLHCAWVGIGSNLGDPVEQVLSGIADLDAIPHTRCEARSSLYRSAPVGKRDQRDFINAVAQVRTALAPAALLAELLAIEAHHGRVRGELNGPRTLDLDLLLYDETILNEPDLVLPHPRMHERAFVLLPLAELDPTRRIPGKGLVSELMARITDQHIVRLED